MARSCYKKAWYPYVRQMLNDYQTISKENSEFFQFASWCIEQAYNDLLQSEKEKDIETARAVDMVFFKKTHTYTGAGLELGLSHASIQRRIKSYIYRVGIKMGFD